MVAVGVMAALRVSACWLTDAHLYHSAGVWFALADDLRHGVFYRPLYGPLGYGGTRYAPVVFSLLAGLMSVLRDPRLAGYVLALGSSALLLGGVYALLRVLKVERWLAGAGTFLVLATQTGQDALLAPRGDALPAALVVWALAAAVALPDGWRGALWPALLVALAFAAKLTSLYVAAPIFLYLIFAGRKRRAGQFAAFTAAGVVLACAVVLLASHGRVFEVMKASAAAGGTLERFLSAPQRMAGFLVLDAGILPFVVLAVAALIAWPAKFWQDIAPLFFLTAVAATLVIYGSPGTDYNHLLDVQAAAVVLIVVWISRVEDRAALFGLQALAMAGLLAMIPAWRAHRREDSAPLGHNFEVTLRLLGAHPGPILAENPLLPILAGQRPYLLDPYMFRVLTERRPALAEPMWRMLREHQFAAVVLGKDPQSAFGRAWYSQLDLGSEFVRQLEANYHPALRFAEGEVVYLPRAEK